MKYSFFYVPLILTAIFSSCTDVQQAPERTGIQVDTVAKTPGNGLIMGEKIFEEKCVACHGNDGTAGIANAANLQKSQLSNTDIVNTINNGRGGMPSFKSQLAVGDIQALANYVVTLRNNRP